MIERPDLSGACGPFPLPAHREMGIAYCFKMHPDQMTIYEPFTNSLVSLLTTHYSLLTFHYPLCTTHYTLLTTHYSLPATYYYELRTINY